MTRPSSKPPSLSAKRQSPDLSPDLPLLPSALVSFNGRDVVIHDCKIEDLNLQPLAEKSVSFENCILNRVNLPNSTIPGLKLKDVILDHCDLANVDARGMSSLRVEFRNCRLTGFRANESHVQHTLIAESDGRYLQFRFAVLRAAHLEFSNFHEADFQGTDLRHVIFKNCNLQNVEMTGAKLEDADLRGSNVDGLKANGGDVRGAIVDPAQALALAGVLGLKVR